jgi:hypothetical protein
MVCVYVCKICMYNDNNNILLMCNVICNIVIIMKIIIMA